MGVRGLFCLGVVAFVLAACAPRSADRTPSGTLSGEGGAGRPGPPTEPGNAAGGANPGGPPAAGSGGSGGTAGSASGGSGGSPLPPPPPDLRPPDTLAPDAAPPDIGPPLLDALASTCNNLPAWREGVQYAEGADVTHMIPRRRFECRPWPYTPWCALPVYEPGRTRHWPEAWIDRGQCP
jgi:hypothetical protein